MTPKTYWLGWLLMAAGFIVVMGLVCYYIGAKLDAILEALRGH